jgi:alpha-tubulin suppressor-like RCC1 family protein
MAAGLAHGLAVKGSGAPRILGPSAYRNSSYFGSSLPFQAKVVGQQPLVCQWLAGWVPIDNATNISPQIPAALGTDGVKYQLIVSNALGCLTNYVANVRVRSVNAWGDNPFSPTRIPKSVANPIAISAGPFHVLALQENGAVVAWGANSNGQANVPAGLANTVMVAAGGSDSLALKSDGTVLAWGRNDNGQVTVPAGATNVVAIGAGWSHSVALRADGTVVAWGNNDYGQCAVSFLADQVVAIAAGYFHTLALRADGSVVSWGSQSDVPPAATNITAIAAGWGHSLALRADGTILAWGDNSNGQCTVPAAATNVVAISAGWYHSMALRSDGTVVSWGKGGTSVTSPPVGLTAVGSIAAGEDYCFAVAQSASPRFLQPVSTVTATIGGQLFFNPTVSCAGPVSYQWIHDGVAVQDATNRFLLVSNAQLSDSGSYQLAVSYSGGQSVQQVAIFNVAPAKTSSAVGAWGGWVYSSDSAIAPGITDPVAIAAGDFHNLILQADGSVVACGNNLYNQTNIPPDLTNVVAVAAGYYFNLALRSDRSIVAWGKNNDGETNVPPAATNVIAIAARQNHALALRADGSVVAWGDNTFNQTNIPTGLTGVIDIALGYSHSLALRSDHTVVAWGTEWLTPASATNVMSIAAGADHSLALKADGTVIAWGDNAYGQCNVPDSATNAVAIAAGYRHSLALLADGHLVAWGQNYTYGASSNAANAVYFVTNIPAGLRDVACIACGTDHDLALVTHGTPDFEVNVPSTPAHVGESPILTARGGGTQPLTYQWYHDSNAIPDATNRWLQLGNVQVADAGGYTLVASNGAGLGSGIPVNLEVHPEPYFLPSFPLQQNRLLGTPATLAANVGGAQPLHYQARLNGLDLQDGGRISGSTTPTFGLNPASGEDNGLLDLVVTNDFGSFTGRVANVVVTPILAWGDNCVGQCFVPAAASNAVSITCGMDHSLAVCSDGRVVAWGDNTWGQINVPDSANGAIAVAAGDYYSMALRADGTVVVWGDNRSGQTNVPGTVQNAIAISAGSGPCLALLASGGVVQWPFGSVPPEATNCVAIAAGGAQCLALRADGTVVGWQGFGTVPASASNVVAIAAGDLHGLALRADGTVVAWGDNRFGQTNVPASATSVVAISARGNRSFAVRSDGALVAWGDDYSGPNQIPAVASNLRTMAIGGSHFLAQLWGEPKYAAISNSAGTMMLGDSTSLYGSAVSGTRTWYQWRYNGMNLSGATNPVLAVSGFNWTNAGTYTLIASNGLGLREVKSVTLSASRLPLQFDAGSIRATPADGGFQCRVVGAAGIGNLVVFASTNLHDWAPVFTNPPVIGNLIFTNFAAGTDAPLFFRAAEVLGSQGIFVNLAIPDPTMGSEGWLVTLTGLTASAPVVVAASTNLVDWTPIFTNPPTIGPMRFLAPPSTNGVPQFYRAYEQH